MGSAVSYMKFSHQDSGGELGYVYVVHHPSEPRFKIGTSMDPGNRLNTLGLLEKSNFKNDFYFRCYAHDIRLIESSLHKLLARFRIKGLPRSDGSTEWFMASAYPKMWQILSPIIEMHDLTVIALTRQSFHNYRPPTNSAATANHQKIYRYRYSLAKLRVGINYLRKYHHLFSYSHSVIRWDDAVFNDLRLYFKIDDGRAIQKYRLEEIDESFEYELTTIVDDKIVHKHFRNAWNISGVIPAHDSEESILEGFFSIGYAGERHYGGTAYEKRLNNRIFTWLMREILSLGISKYNGDPYFDF